MTRQKPARRRLPAQHLPGWTASLLAISLLGWLVIKWPPVTGSAQAGSGEESSSQRCPGDQAASGSTAGETVRSTYLFGVINDQGDHYADQWARGVRATTLEVQWKRYEPQEGYFDAAYIGHLKDRMRGLKAQGWFVQLVPGFHYAPDWVFTNYPGQYYVNQFGEAYDPDPVDWGDFRVINAPFSPQARALISAYLARLFQDFDQTDPGLQFDSVRVGGGVQGELRYPPSDWNGHTNAFWAFDSDAQASSVSGIPTSVVGWKPGIDPNPGSLGRGQLIVNPGFEDQHPDLQILAWSPEDEVVTQVLASDPFEGSRALALTVTSPHRVYQYVRVEPNTTYQFGSALRSQDGLGLARVFFDQYGAGMDAIPGAPFAKLESDASAWSVQTSSLTTTSETQFLRVGLDGDRPGNYQFDSLWLKRDGETDNRDRDIEVPLAFYDWYVARLADYQDWQITELRQYTNAQLDLVYAGKGVLPNQITIALTNDLWGDSRSESSRGLYGGSAYDRLVANLSPTQGVVIYLTGIDEPPPQAVNDQTPYPGDWSAARWLTYLARSRDLPIWGENSGQDDPATLSLVAARMHANRFLGMIWGFESELYANPNPIGYASIDDYQGIINYYASLVETYLPMVISRP